MIPYIRDGAMLNVSRCCLVVHLAALHASCELGVRSQDRIAQHQDRHQASTRSWMPY